MRTSAAIKAITYSSAWATNALAGRKLTSAFPSVHKPLAVRVRANPRLCTLESTPV